MLTGPISDILSASRDIGWVLEPDAKQVLKSAGLPTPRHELAATPEEAIRSAGRIGYPVAAKVVSPAVMHKTEYNGVALGIVTDDDLMAAFNRFERMDQFRGMLVEEMVTGVELIVGATIDSQFGPVILLGIGGIGVELYGDTAIRMAPLTEKDVRSMVSQLKGRRLLQGFRGAPPVAMAPLTDLVIRFSELIMDLEKQITSIDLNPVMCTATGCVVADARIILAGKR
ncbi:MAG: acetyl-CoA synthetase [Deltaproteobacteria bacterium]|nr:MAG: acetyl-CoA synthetase [Deltaproteobacteria bacterium]